MLEVYQEIARTYIKKAYLSAILSWYNHLFDSPKKFKSMISNIQEKDAQKNEIVYFIN